MANLFTTFFSCCVRKPSVPIPNVNVYEPDENSHLIPTTVQDSSDANPEEAEAQRRFEQLAQIVRVHESKMANVIARRPFTVYGDRASSDSSASNSRSGSAQRNPYSSQHAYGATASTQRFASQQSRSGSRNRDEEDEDDTTPLSDIQIVDYSVLDDEPDSDDDRAAAKPEAPDNASVRSDTSRGRARARAAANGGAERGADLPQDTPKPRPFSYAAAVRSAPTSPPPT